MIDKEGVELEIKTLHYRIEDTDQCIDDYKKKIIYLKRQKKELKKKLLEYQQLLWTCGGEE